MRRLALATALATTSTFAFADAPKVVTDIGPVQALVSQIMGEAGTPTQILPANASPHGYAMRPSEARAIADADLIFWVGPELMPQLDRAIESIAPDTPEIALLHADGVERLEYREGPFLGGHDDHEGHGHDEHKHGEHGHDEDKHAEHDHDEEKHAGHDHDEDKHAEHGHDEHKHSGHNHEHGEEKHAEHDHDEHKHGEHDHGEEKHAEHDHDEEKHAGHEGHDHDHHGHAHEGVDPHAWMSPHNLAAWAKVIATELSAKDPGNAGTYWANATAEIERIEALHEELKVKLEPAHDKPFLVFHDAYQYFEHEFDIDAGATLLTGDAARPSAEALSEIREELEHMAEEGPVCIFTEPQYDTSLVDSLSEGTDVRSGVLDPLGSKLPQDANLHRAILTALAENLSSCLTGERS